MRLPRYYGSGESFVFSFDRDDVKFKVWPWSARNSLIMFSDENNVAIGGGTKPAFQFDSSFLRGYAYPYCETFLSHRLSTEEEFIMDECEVWLFSEWERS